MKLDDAQMTQVRTWIEQGMKVAEIQSRLSQEFGLQLTYMEARFLLDDLQLRPKDPTPPPAPAPAAATSGGAAGAGSSLVAGPGTGGAGRGAAPTLSGPSGAPLKMAPLAGDAASKVVVSMDSITRPGALVSGKVTFSDGQSADWQMDQYGRLGVAPKIPGYKPSQADVASFQAELEAALARLGY
jgi:hypothetical protein